MRPAFDYHLLQEDMEKLLLKLYILSVPPSKKAVSIFVALWVSIARQIPGADVLFLALVLWQLRTFLLQDGCVTYGSFLFVYDVLVTALLILGFVIYLSRRYFLNRKSA